MFKSIRHGLFAALAGFTVLICACYTGLALVIAYVAEDMLVDRLLQREAAAITAHFQTHGEVKAPGNDLISVHRSPDTLPPVVRAEAAGRARAEIFAGPGRHYHLRTLELGVGGGRAWLLADAGPLLVVSKLIQDVGGVLLFVALGLVALALLLAWLLARRLVAPLLVLAQEVRGVTANGTADGTATFSARRRPDEIGFLAERLGSAIADLHAALRREHEFTRDVSHELRTPLTVMNNVLAQAGTLGRHDVAQLQAGLDELRATIDALFALARAEHIAAETFDLRGCIEDSLLRMPDAARWGGDALVLDLPGRLPVTGNRHLARLLVDNCLRNALFHGAPGLRVSFAAGVLAIENAVDPGRAGTTQGFMHGQNLLARIAAAMGWEIGFHAGAGTYRVAIVPMPVPMRD